MAFHFETQNPGEVLPAPIGPYKVLQKLGGGGFGTVYFVRKEGSDSPLALKVLATSHLPPSLRSQALRRFQSEALVSNQINHPGVIMAVDAGCDEIGNYYIAMEYLAGVSFKRHFVTRREAMALGNISMDEIHREIAFLGHQIASAMVAAHDKKIYHRDLKPENVMVIEDPFALWQLRIKVLDFGIAKFPPEIFMALANPAGFTAHWTREGAFLGTPPYMAPEQWGHAGEVTGEADVYALGVMLYEVLAGIEPDELANPPRPIRELAPSLSEAWDNLVSRMMAREPTHRPGMAEVAQRLQALAREYGELAAAVLKWEQSGRHDCAVGQQLYQFFGWAEGKHLTEGESEFLRASAIANAELERRAAATKVEEEQRIARLALDAEHRQRTAAEAQVQADAALRAVAAERERAQEEALTARERALAAQRKVRNVLVVALALLGPFLVFALVQWNGAVDARGETEKARLEVEESLHKLTEAKTEKEKTTALLGAVGAQLDSAQEETEKIRRSKLSADEKLTRLQDAFDRLSGTANLLSNLRKELEARIIILDAENKRLQRELATTIQERDEARATVRALEGQLATATREREEARARARDLEGQLTTVNRERDEARARARDLEGQLTTADRERDEARTRVRDLEGRITTTAYQLATLQGQLSACQQRPPCPTQGPPDAASPARPMDLTRERDLNW